MPYKSQAAQNEFQRVWKQAHRLEYFAGKVCAWCGSGEHLQLHHVDKSKKRSHRIWSWKAERREAELKICIVLCMSCHMSHHAEERRKPHHEILADMAIIEANFKAAFG